MELTTLTYRDSKWQAEFPPLDSKQTLVLVFGAPEFRDHPEPVEQIARTYPNSVVIGCSTSGEIFDEEIHDNSLSVAIVKFDHARLEYAESHVQSSGDSFFAGQDIATRLFKPDLRGIIVLSEGIHINGSELVRGMNSIVPESVVVTGGLAGDGPRFERTWVLRKGCVE